MMTDTERKVAVVTGAGRGLGRAAAQALAEAGWRTVLACRASHDADKALADLLKLELPVELFRVDVTATNEVQALARHLERQYGHVDVLINNAGVFLESSSDTGERSADPLKVAPATVLATFESNTLGAMRMIQALAPLMTQGARIVNVSSGMGQLADMGGGYLGYRMSKTALNALTRVFATSLAERGVLVNACCPGWVRTDMGGKKAARSIAEGIETIVWLAISPEVTTSGGFYRDRQPLPW